MNAADAGRTAADDVIWRIGDPARGIEQYSSAWFTGPTAEGPTFRVGTSSEAADWPIIHPGPLNASTGWQPCTATIVFAGPHDRGGAFELVLDVLAIKGPCPDLEVKINGRSGLVVLEPWRDDRTRVPITTPIAGWSTVSIHVPGDALVEGDNEITLTTVNPFEPEPDERRRPQPFFESWFHFGSGITYGSIEFRRARLAEPPEPRVRLTALPLYQRDGSGCLVELVDVVVNAPRGYASGTLRLSVGEHTTEASLTRSWSHFGDTRLRLAVPDADDVRPARVELDLDGALRSFELEFRPARKWQLHLLPHVHLDVGYTDYQGKVFELHSRNVDRALAILDAQPEYALSIDGSLIVDEYCRSRSPDTSARLITALRERSFACNAFYASFLTGVVSLEECYRVAAAARQLSEQHGIRFDYANLTDVPSYSQALPSVLASLGLSRFMGIINHGRAANEDSDEMHLRSPFRWEGPDGAHVTAFFSDCYSQLRFLGADPPTVVGCADGFNRLLARYDRDDYLPHDFPIVGIHADNEDLANGEADLVARWNATYEYPKLRYSTIADYFDAVEPLAERLPVVRGDGGSYWEDGVGGDAASIARYRRTQAELPAAETTAALAALVDPSLQPARAVFDDAWSSLCMGGEHTWTSWHAQSMYDADQTLDQLDWKRHKIAHAARLARGELHRAISQLGERVTTTGPAMIVVNTFGWPRAGSVEVDLADGVEVVGADGHRLPTDPFRTLRGGVRRVRVWVPEIPAFGYRAFTLTTGATAADAPDSGAPMALTPVIETPRYRITTDVERGRVIGLQHRASGRQLLDTSDYALGEVIYVEGGGDDEHGHTSLYDWARHLPSPTLRVHRVTVVESSIERRSGSTVLRLVGRGPTLERVETEIELGDHTDRVDVRVRLVKQPTPEKESVYVAFPFAVADPVVRYDRQQGWVDPARDHLPGACNEWFTVQHAVSVTSSESGADGSHGITWSSADAPLFTVGDIVRGRWPREFQTRKATLLSWAMNNYWWTNYPVCQGGDVQLRYAFEPTGGWEPGRSARFGREVRTALLAGDVTWLDKFDTAPRELPTAGQSIVDAELSDGLVATLHGAADGRGTIVRVQDTAGVPGSARLRLPGGVRAAWTCSAAELDRVELPIDGDGDAACVHIAVAPFQVATVRLVGGRA